MLVTIRHCHLLHHAVSTSTGSITCSVPVFISTKQCHVLHRAVFVSTREFHVSRCAGIISTRQCHVMRRTVLVSNETAPRAAWGSVCLPKMVQRVASTVFVFTGSVARSVAQCLSVRECHVLNKAGFLSTMQCPVLHTKCLSQLAVSFCVPQYFMCLHMLAAKLKKNLNIVH